MYPPPPSSLDMIVEGLYLGNMRAAQRAARNKGRVSLEPIENTNGGEFIQISYLLNVSEVEGYNLDSEGVVCVCARARACVNPYPGSCTRR